MEKSPRKRAFLGGAGGNRTRVQTRKPRAFYMLSDPLIFVGRPRGHALPVA